jgi:iron complex transport system ATP-binding protein
MKLVATRARVRFPQAARPALLDVSLALGPGEIVAVTGPNGSGKTTLLKALLGLVPLASGTVELDGKALASWARADLAGVISALPQREEPAFPLTVREAVLLGRWARLGPVAPVGRDDAEAVAAALERCDMTGFDQRTLDTLSGGEWQRVRLARALVAGPKLLLLDEPTAALDINHEMALFELLDTLRRDGLGVLVITHDLNLAARFADRILLLDRGAAMAAGHPRTVLEAGTITRVFGWPVTVAPGPDGAPQVTPLRPGDPRPATP